MNERVKALLLGVDLDFRVQESGSSVRDHDRTASFSEALNRLEIDTDNLRPGTFSSMLDDAEQVILWLIDHPQSAVRLGYWTVEVESSVEFEKHDCPFGLRGAVEDFTKTETDGHWWCCWSLG